MFGKHKKGELWGNGLLMNKSQQFDTDTSSASFFTTSSFFRSNKMTVSMDNKNEEEPTYLMLLLVCTFHWEKTSQMTQEDYHHLEGKTWTIQSLPLMTSGYRRAGVDPGFFLGGGALVSCSTSTPINHIVFFFFCRIPVVLENRRSSQGGVRTPCTLPQDPPLEGSIN